MAAWHESSIPSACAARPTGLILERHAVSDWYRRFDFDRGAMQPDDLPQDTGDEVVFAGRSNVGKSSVINTITDRQALARTSKTPGRTRQINYFSNAAGQRLVDLPGYGYARVSRDIRRKWSRLLPDYFSTRKSIRGILLIMDVRHPFTGFDEHMLACITANQLAAHVLLNKADKLSKDAGRRVQQQLAHQIVPKGISIQLFSASKRQGIAEARKVIAAWLGAGEPK